MTPEEKFIQLNIKGCTWESLRVIDRDELTRILKESNVVMSFSLLEIFTILELWRLRQLETSALLCKQVESPWLNDRFFLFILGIENLPPGDINRRTELYASIDRSMEVFGWSPAPFEQYDELRQLYGRDTAVYSMIYVLIVALLS
jgi:hypothetical protein